jgi:hypothetical protein
VAHLNARLRQRRLEREAAPDQERDQIGPLVPECARIRRFFRQPAIAPHAVQGQIGAQVGPLRQHGCEAARLSHVQHGAGLGVALGEKQKVPRPVAGQGDQVGLRQAGRHARRGRNEALAIGKTRGLGWSHEKSLEKRWTNEKTENRRAA